MASRNQPGMYDVSPDDVHADEPVFVLRGQDILAATVVDEWARLAEAAGCPAGKVAEARHCADLMRAWPHRKMPD